MYKFKLLQSLGNPQPPAGTPFDASPFTLATYHTVDPGQPGPPPFTDTLPTPNDPK